MTGYAEAGGLLFTVTAATYAASLGNYIASLVTPRKIVERLATLLRLLFAMNLGCHLSPGWCAFGHGARRKGLTRITGTNGGYRRPVATA